MNDLVEGKRAVEPAVAEPVGFEADFGIGTGNRVQEVVVHIAVGLRFFDLGVVGIDAVVFVDIECNAQVRDKAGFSVFGQFACFAVVEVVYPVCVTQCAQNVEFVPRGKENACRYGMVGDGTFGIGIVGVAACPIGARHALPVVIENIVFVRSTGFP